MILMTFETPNFTFNAVSHTQKEAEKAMRSHWRVHCETTGASLDYFDMAAVRFDEIEFNEVLCR